MVLSIYLQNPTRFSQEKKVPILKTCSRYQPCSLMREKRRRRGNQRNLNSLLIPNLVSFVRCERGKGRTNLGSGKRWVIDALYVSNPPQDSCLHKHRALFYRILKKKHITNANLLSSPPRFCRLTHSH